MKKDKKHLLNFFGILVPVVIAAITELGDQIEAKEQEKEMNELRRRIDKLENDKEA